MYHPESYENAYGNGTVAPPRCVGTQQRIESGAVVPVTVVF